MLSGPSPQFYKASLIQIAPNSHCPRCERLTFGTDPHPNILTRHPIAPPAAHHGTPPQAPAPDCPQKLVNSGHALDRLKNDLDGFLQQTDAPQTQARIASIYPIQAHYQATQRHPSTGTTPPEQHSYTRTKVSLTAIP